MTKSGDRSAAEILRRKHREEHPNCTYGDKSHYVPPSFGQVGFYLCDPPADLTNHSRVDIRRCTCDPVEQGGTVHHPYCETNHPHHPCDERSCRFAAPPAASIPDTELRERHARAMWAERDTEVERLRAEAIRHGERATEEFGRAEELMAEVERLAGERDRVSALLRGMARRAIRFRREARAHVAEAYRAMFRSEDELAALRAQQQDMVRLPADARGEIERLLSANVGKPAGGVAHKVMLLLTDDWRASPASTEDQAGGGSYDDASKHHCPSGHETVYQPFSSGREWYCETCDMFGLYPAGTGGPRARLIQQPGGIEELKRQLAAEPPERQRE